MLSVEAGITTPQVIAAALLHDTIEDTDTRPEELEHRFGPEVRAIVIEVSDDKRLKKSQRKRLQVENAAGLSPDAKLVELADKICNLRDMHSAPPEHWDLQRRREYFDWAKNVIDKIRGCHTVLERIFDEAFAFRP